MAGFYRLAAADMFVPLVNTPINQPTLAKTAILTVNTVLGVRSITAPVVEKDYSWIILLVHQVARRANLLTTIMFVR